MSLLDLGTLPADGDTIDAADVNNPLIAVKAVINGGIDASNITDGAVTNVKFASTWQSWTPTITVSGGTAPTYTGNFQSLYIQIGSLVIVRIYWTNYTGGTAGTGTNPLIFTLPVATTYDVNNLNPPMGTYQVNNGGSENIGMVVQKSATTAAFMSNMPNVYIQGQDQGSTGRYCQAVLTYEAA